MQTILVTGGCGFIGAHTIVDLLENGFNVISIDNLSRASDASLLGIEKITGKKITNYTILITMKILFIYQIIKKQLKTYQKIYMPLISLLKIM